GLATALFAVEQEAAAVEEPEALEAVAGRPEKADVAQHAGRQGVREVDVIVGEQRLRGELAAAVAVLGAGIGAGREPGARLPAGLEGPVGQYHPLKAVRVAVGTTGETGVGFHAFTDVRAARKVRAAAKEAGRVRAGVTPR